MEYYKPDFRSKIISLCKKSRNIKNVSTIKKHFKKDIEPYFEKLPLFLERIQEAEDELVEFKKANEVFRTGKIKYSNGTILIEKVSFIEYQDETIFLGLSNKTIRLNAKQFNYLKKVFN